MPFSRRHRFISTIYYELPFGHNRKFGAGTGRALDLVVGGWDLSGILLIQSGPLLTLYFSGGDPLGIGADTRGFSGFYRPDQVGDGNLSNPTPDQWFDPTRSSRHRTTAAATATPKWDRSLVLTPKCSR